MVFYWTAVGCLRISVETGVIFVLQHLLRPDQYTAPKELLEFSRQRQEDKIIEGIKEDIKQLDHEEVDLEVRKQSK